MVTALQKTGQGHVLGVIPFALPAGGYLSTVMPSILAVWVASYIQKFFTKITPDVIKVFVVPFFTLLITVPLTFLVVGPVANTFSDGLTNLFQAIMNFSPIVFGLILGISWQVLVMFECTGRLFPCYPRCGNKRKFYYSFGGYSSMFHANRCVGSYHA